MNNPGLERNKGFTLLELLVVIAIIGVLSGLVLVSMSGSRQKARDSRRFSDFRQISPAMESINNDDSSYPKNDQIAGTLPAIKNSSDFQYLAAMTDPINDAIYKYVWVDNNGTGNCGILREGMYYCILTKMEMQGDCVGDEKRYFIVNQSGQKTICDSNDYVATPPAVCTCIDW